MYKTVNKKVYQDLYDDRLDMLVWWPDENWKLYESALLSVLAISGIISKYFSLREFRSKIEM